MPFQVALVVNNPPLNAGDWRDTDSIPVGKIPRIGNGNPLVFLPGKLPGQRSLTGYTVHGEAENWTKLRKVSRHSLERRPQ